MKDLLEDILHELVEYPDSLKVQETIGTQNAIYEIHCHTTDIGKIIGKEAHMIGALRTIFNVIAGKKGYRINLTVIQ